MPGSSLIDVFERRRNIATGPGVRGGNG